MTCPWDYTGAQSTTHLHIAVLYICFLFQEQLCHTVAQVVAICILRPYEFLHHFAESVCPCCHKQARSTSTECIAASSRGYVHDVEGRHHLSVGRYNDAECISQRAAVENCKGTSSCT